MRERIGFIGGAGRALAALAALEAARTGRAVTIARADGTFELVDEADMRETTPRLGQFDDVRDLVTTYTIDDPGMRVYPPAFWDNRPMLRAPRSEQKYRGYQPWPKADPEKDKAKRKAASRARAITKRNRK
jgi:hypothetical protein